MTEQPRDEHGRFKEKKSKNRIWWFIGIAGMLILLIPLLLTQCNRDRDAGEKDPITKPAPSVPAPTPAQPPISEGPPIDPDENENEPDTVQRPEYEDGIITDDGTIDDRLTDPNDLDMDDDLKIGDGGIEEKLGAEPFATLRKLYPNKAITGTYPVNDVIAFGSKYFGRPYQYGSNRYTDTTFDCSDFTRWIWWKAAGMDIPKDSRKQWTYVSTFGKRHYWNLDQAQRGDLLFFMSYKGYKASNYAGIDKTKQPITHCGIYLGDGKIMHTASKASGGVRIDSIRGKHLEFRFLAGGSVL